MRFNNGDIVKYTGHCAKGRGGETATVIGYSTKHNSNTNICIIEFADKGTWECHDGWVSLVKLQPLYKEGEMLWYTGSRCKPGEKIIAVVTDIKVHPKVVSYTINLEGHGKWLCEEQWLKPYKKLEPEYMLNPIAYYPKWMLDVPRGKTIVCYVSNDGKPCPSDSNFPYITDILDFNGKGFVAYNNAIYKYAIPVDKVKDEQRGKLQEELVKAEEVVLSIKQQIKEVRI